jgi:eukaryotic-like serine/threonine-protein kinase
MDPKNWQKVRSVLESSLELPPDERSEYLDSACPDEDIRREVDSLLAFEDSDEGILETPAISAVIADREASAMPMAGRVLGKYRIEREIGAGGMGTVYLANRADGEFEQRVAIKLISGGMDSEAILRRFLNERRILASLEHPNIARLIDGGTAEDGRPYLVMEYVEGTPITTFAADEGLDIAQRLDLFREVCSAVSVAHQNLVIHRDLKPSNILVGKDGKPKLLDFGIAKLLTSDGADNTRTQQFAFTPEYASPEQIRGENLTTATDVYSLGVILYELLTETRPFTFEGKGLGQMIDIATLSHPTRPSSAVKRVEDGKKLRGDLDNIVLKALNKEPERRYTTVQEFSEDIRRYLKGLPVHARQDTFEYRAGKFVRRNPLFAASATLTFIILVTGIIATTYLASQAEAERNRAENRFNDVRELANSFIFEINDTIVDSPIKARELLVSRAIEYLDKLAAESRDDESLQLELAAAYEKISDVQTEFFGSSTGDSAGALLSNQKALEIRRALHERYPANDRYTLQLAATQIRIAGVLVSIGHTEIAPEYYDNAVALIEELATRSPEDREIQEELANAYAKQGQGILRTGSISRTLEKFERAANIIARLAQKHPDDKKLAHRVSVYESYTGYAKYEMGLKDEANRHFQRALEIDREIYQTEPGNLVYRGNLATAELWAGIGLRGVKQYDASLAHQYRSLEIQEELLALDPSNLGYVNSLADSHLEIGWTSLSVKGREEKAAEHLEKAIELYTMVIKTDPGNLSPRRQAAFARVRLGDALVELGNKNSARSAYKTALDEIGSILSKNEKNSEFRHDLAVCLIRLAELDGGPKDRVIRAIEILEALTRESPEHQARSEDLAKARSILSKLR